MFFADTIAETLLGWYASLLPYAQWALVVAVFVLGPPAIVRPARGIASSGFVWFSNLVGLTTYLLGAGVALATFGWFGILIGMAFFGVGTVFVGIAGAFFVLDDSSLALAIVVMSALTYFARAVAGELRASVDARPRNKNREKPRSVTAPYKRPFER